MEQNKKTINYIQDIKKKLVNKKYIYQFLPNKLRKLIVNKPTLSYKNRNLKHGYLVDILHHMIIKYYSYGEREFNLSSEVMRERYGTWYNFYIGYLIDNEIIKMKSNYFVGKKSKTYFIPKFIIDDGMTRYKNYDKVLVKKYKSNIINNEIDDVNYSYISTNTRNKLINDLFYVDIDIDKASNHLLEVDKKSYDKNKYSIEAINNNHIFYHFDNYGRIHTNFTILKSLIRKNCLTIDGYETSEVDIKNSQPLFLTAIIDKFDLNLSGIDSDEYDIFKRLTINGGLYQYFMNQFDIKSKKEVKLLIYKVLFGKNLDDQYNKMFQQLFPTIHNFIILYKEDSGDYKSLAYDLQRSESNLIFNKIIEDIMCENPDIKLFTVHDSIVFPKQYKDIVENIFYSNLKKAFQI